MPIPIKTHNPEASNLHTNISKTIVKPEIHKLIIDSMMINNNSGASMAKTVYNISKVASSDEDEDEEEV
ncbi:15240_t:CDS:2 [Entrophospora sp. SA101]|nr:15240_t:CDS:2 [Entrophospora sp. SA101]